MQNFKKNLISIITVVKNSAPTIEKCIKSILDQDYDRIEYIIVDGKSDDGTIKILEKYKKNINKIIIENDNGIWDGMNKGISIATGDVICFLNADDFFKPGAIKLVNEYFNNYNIDFLFGSVKKFKLMHGYKPWKIKWSFGFYTSHSVGFFIKREKHLMVGKYNLKYLSADLDFFYRMIVNFKLKGMSTKKDEIMGEFAKGGFSSKINYITHLKDLNQIRINNNQNKVFVYLLFIFKLIKSPLRFLKSFNN